MVFNIDKFSKLAGDITKLWEEYSGYNDEIDKKYEELDQLLTQISSNPKAISAIEENIETKSNNFFERLLFARLFIENDHQKARRILKYVTKNDNGKAAFLAKSALMNL